MSITLSESAAKRVKSYMADGKSAGLRLGVRTTGCSGLAYVIELTDTIASDDHVFEHQGVKIIVNEKSLPYLDGTELRFEKQGLSEAFKFNNPNVKGECGCGESFSV